MNLKEYRTDFYGKLASYYPEEEIRSFFYLLVENYLAIHRAGVVFQFDRVLSRNELYRLDKALNMLQRQVPIQYIIGETEFCGLPFKVNPSVLIPRPETEELVDWIINECFEKQQQTVKILDIGTGSGCIAVSLAKFISGAQVSALDVSSEALQLAKVNARQNEVSVHFVGQDILTIERLHGNYDIIVSNPPYVRMSEKEKMQPNVLLNEPHAALFVADHEPLLFYKKIAQLALKSLRPGGALYFEINEAYGNDVVDMLKTEGFKAPMLRTDIFGKDRMVKGSVTQ